MGGFPRVDASLDGFPFSPFPLVWGGFPVDDVYSTYIFIYV